jgi:hypothetical protein
MVRHRRPVMHRVDQAVTADVRRGDGAAADGTPGDCLRACVASLLGLPLADVPHFAQHGHGWWDAWRRWMRHRFTLDVGCLAPDTVRGAGLVLARGPSPRGPFGHVVVAEILDGGPALRTVHDPHPSRAGLAGLADEVYAVVGFPCWPPPAQYALTVGPHAVPSEND